MFFYQELYFDSLMSQNKLVQYIANSMILKSDIILLLISNNKVADGFFFFFFRNGFYVREKGCTNQNNFFFCNLFLLVAYLDQNLQCLKGLHYVTNGQTFNGIKKTRGFIRFYAFCSLASKWQQIRAFGEKTNTDQTVFTFRQNICQTLNFNNIIFLHTRFTYDTCT